VIGVALIGPADGSPVHSSWREHASSRPLIHALDRGGPSFEAGFFFVLARRASELGVDRRNTARTDRDVSIVARVPGYGDVQDFDPSIRSSRAPMSVLALAPCSHARTSRRPTRPDRFVPTRVSRRAAADFLRGAPGFRPGDPGRATRRTFARRRDASLKRVVAGRPRPCGPRRPTSTSCAPGTSSRSSAPPARPPREQVAHSAADEERGDRHVRGRALQPVSFDELERVLVGVNRRPLTNRGSQCHSSARRRRWRRFFFNRRGLRAAGAGFCTGRSRLRRLRGASKPSRLALHKSPMRVTPAASISGQRRQHLRSRVGSPRTRRRFSDAMPRATRRPAPAVAGAHGRPRQRRARRASRL